MHSTIMQRRLQAWRRSSLTPCMLLDLAKSIQDDLTGLILLTLH